MAGQRVSLQVIFTVGHLCSSSLVLCFVLVKKLLYHIKCQIRIMQKLVYMQCSYATPEP